MGPRARYLGPEVPAEALIWQDPVPAVDHPLIDEADIAALKEKILASGLTRVSSWCRPRGRRRPRSAAPTSAAAPTARASAWRRRRTGRSTSPQQLAKVLAELEGIQKEFNDAQRGGKKVSLADLIVLGGAAGVEQAREERRPSTSTVPFTPGRTDASQEQTDVASFARARAARRRLPQLPQGQVQRAGRDRCWSTRRNC